MLIPGPPGLEDCCYPHEVSKDSSAVKDNVPCVVNVPILQLFETYFVV